jgi:hypothetical protein
MMATACEWCERKQRRTLSEYTVRDSAGVTRNVCVDHLSDAIFTAMVMSEEVWVKKVKR